VPRLSRARLWPLALALGGLCCRPPGPDPSPARLVIYDAPLSLDPHRRDEHLTFSVLANVYEGLVRFDRELCVRPALATQWENPDDRTWRFRLRRGVRFHDGSPFGAADVAFSLERASQPSSELASFLTAVEEVRVVNDETLEVVTDRPYAILLNKLAWIAIVPRYSPSQIRRPVGTGPYRLVSNAPGKPIVLQSFEGYWRASAREREVHLIPEPDPQRRLAMLTSGRADVIAELSPEGARCLESHPCCRVVAQDSLAVAYLQMRVDREPFDDIRVRRAINCALDREALVKEDLLGWGRPVGQMVSRQVFGYVPDLAPTTPDPAKARRLLAEAGYASGLDLVLELRPSRRAEGIRAQLAEVGIRVEPISRPWDELYHRLRSGEVDFYYGGFASASGDASDVFDVKLHSPDPERGYGETNFIGYSSPKLDRLIEASGESLDPNLRRRHLEAAMRELMSDLPLVPLYVAHSLFGVREDVEWEPGADGLLLAEGLRRSPKRAH
jgi:ABC-type transport system substrate-binding protein